MYPPDSQIWGSERVAALFTSRYSYESKFTYFTMNMMHSTSITALLIVLGCIYVAQSMKMQVTSTYTHKLGPWEIISFDDSAQSSQIALQDNQIMLFDTKNGWGTGSHPTTSLCLDFMQANVKEGDVVLDYGTGSGILSILAAKLGAKRCISVDIDEDTLIAAQHNAEMNKVGDRVEVIHTKTVYIGDDSFPAADVTVANILPGPLSRLVAPLWFLTKPGGWLCLSGMRPAELPGIRRIYEPFVDVKDEVVKQKSHDQFGDWVSWSVKTKVMSAVERKEKIQYLNELSIN